MGSGASKLNSVDLAKLSGQDPVQEFELKIANELSANEVQVIAQNLGQNRVMKRFILYDYSPYFRFEHLCKTSFSETVE